MKLIEVGCNPNFFQTPSREVNYCCYLTTEENSTDCLTRIAPIDTNGSLAICANS